MILRQRPAIRVAALGVTQPLFALLRAVVMRRAQALQVPRVHQLRPIALVRDDVVDDGGGGRSAGALAHDAERVSGEMGGAQRAPCGAVASGVG